ncbi:unnamed protein product, partial [Linum tenue]
MAQRSPPSLSHAVCAMMVLGDGIGAGMQWLGEGNEQRY